MTALKIIGIILASLAFLITVLLISPLRIKVRLDEGGGLFFYLKLLGIPIVSVYPGKKKKEKKKKKTDGTKKKKEREAPKTGIGKLISELSSIKETLFEGDISETIEGVLRLLDFMFRELSRILPRCKVKKLHLSVVFSDEDPAKEAIQYGIACAAVYPFVGFLESYMRVKSRGLSVNMQCSFGTREQSVTFDTVIDTPIFRLAAMAVRFIIEEIKNAIREEGKI